jgi:hypothetical protein
MLATILCLLTPLFQALLIGILIRLSFVHTIMFAMMAMVTVASMHKHMH